MQHFLGNELDEIEGVKTFHFSAFDKSQKEL
jgi:hypothetical protein